MKQSKLIVITGSIGSGKSTVTNIIKEKGFSVIDADKISKRIYLKGKEAYFEILESFGNDILDFSEEIDRKKLANLIFSDVCKRRILNRITHKYIFIEMKEKIQKLNTKTIFLDIPIYFQVRDKMKSIGIVPDIVCLIFANRDIQMERIQRRDGFTKEETELRLNAQKCIVDELREADYIISNNETVIDLKIKVDKFLDMVDA